MFRTDPFPPFQIRSPNSGIRNKFKIRKSSKAQNGARLTRFAIRISVLWVCFGFRVSDFGFRARSGSLRGTIPKTRKLGLHERYAANAYGKKGKRRRRKKESPVELVKETVLSLPTTVGAFVTFIQVVLVPCKPVVNSSRKSGNPYGHRSVTSLDAVPVPREARSAALRGKNLATNASPVPPANAAAIPFVDGKMGKSNDAVVPAT